MRLQLYTFHRNSAGERVRIALNLKGLAYDYVSVPSLPEGEYRQLNPQGLMPALAVDGAVIPQSGAILDFLERTFPEPPLLPADPITRGRALGFAQLVTGEMHALTIHRVRRVLKEKLGADPDRIPHWTAHWMAEGFRSLEETLAQRVEPWPFCFGDTPGWADLHLVPQLRNARRFGCDIAPYPLLLAVEARCVALRAFRLARPEEQPDFVSPRPIGR